jgi:hypothetical protein
MDPTTIFAPFFAQMFLTLLVWVYMYARRIPFVLSLGSKVDLRKPGELARLSPTAVSNPSDNLKNLFEMPVLFYALALYLFVMREVDTTYVVAAWAFVAFRSAHSIVHSTFNLVLLRFYLYLAATLALWFMLFRAAIRYFGL